MSDWQPPDPTDRQDLPGDAAEPINEPGPPAEEAAAPTDEEWLRLDPRMLLVGPASTLRQFAIPAIIAVVGISGSQGEFRWQIIPPMLVAVLLVGLVPWLTTRYRFTPTQFQLRSGLISRKQLTAPLDRVRSVDIEATLLHRLLSLATVKIGTGVDDTQIELNALHRDRAQELRQTLLARARASRSGTHEPTPGEGAAAHEQPSTLTEHAPGADAGALPDVGEQPEEVLATLQWSWLRFAPLNLALLAVAAAALGFMTQFADDLPMLTEDSARDVWDAATSIAIPLLILGAIMGGLTLWIAVTMVGYALQWSGMRLVRTEETVRLTAGLLTTRSTSVEEKRIRGVRLHQPALMRAFHGASLNTWATGVGEGGTSSVMPPSPLRENERVAGLLLGSDEPLRTGLVSHGLAARRRIHVRRQWWTLLLTVAAGVGVWWFDQPWWLVLAVAVLAAGLNFLLGEASYRLLGHALTPDHLVSRFGTLTSSRIVLEREGIIGWVVTQNLFQRRAGLVTLIATTAAGDERVVVHDVPESAAIEVAATATPQAVGSFLSSGSS